MNNKNFYIFISVLLVIIISFVLYFNPLFSNKPLGLDAMGHLSKISYLKEFGLNVQWDLAWYNGAPFLAYYSPLYYQTGYFFSNIIFGANFLSFLSILLTSIGIFFLINYYSKNKIYSLIFALFFLSVLCTSYYYISVGNHPYVFGIFTIPFTLLFLEKSLENKQHNLLVYSLFFVLAYLTHIFIALTLFLLVGLRLIIYCYFFKRKKLIRNLIKYNLIYLFIPLLISCFWFLPFLSKSGSFIGDEIGYIPFLTHLFGFGNYIIWGKSPGEIGILFGLFIISLFFIRRYFKERDEKIIFLTISSVLFLLLLEGILGKFYPTGVGAIRFILPFSILACVFSGVVLSKKFKNNWNIIFILIILLFLALILNYQTINENYEKYSYNSNYDRYGLIDGIYTLDNFPLKNDFSNYRFGTSRYIFSETLNYKFPWQSQTWGYFDQGILYPKELNNFKEAVWNSDDLNTTINYLDEYGIKYFEIGGQDLKFDNKFNESNEFSLVMNENFADYPFKIYEYKDAKPIISIVFENKSYENYSKYEVIRDNPDRVLINYNFSGNEKILFKEFYHSFWGAKEFLNNEELKIYKTESNFMMVIPNSDSNEVVFYQQKTLFDYSGIFLTFVGLLILLIISKKNLIND